MSFAKDIIRELEKILLVGELPDYLSRRYLKLSKNITFHGQVSDKEYFKIQANSDVLVFANHPQTWGLIIFEE